MHDVIPPTPLTLTNPVERSETKRNVPSLHCFLFALLFALALAAAPTQRRGARVPGRRHRRAARRSRCRSCRAPAIASAPTRRCSCASTAAASSCRASSTAAQDAVDPRAEAPRFEIPFRAPHGERAHRRRAHLLHLQGGALPPRRHALRHELVAEPVHREDVARLLAVVLELLAQLDDEVVDGAVVARARRCPRSSRGSRRATPAARRARTGASAARPRRTSAASVLRARVSVCFLASTTASPIENVSSSTGAARPSRRKIALMRASSSATENGLVT